MFQKIFLRKNIMPFIRWSHQTQYTLLGVGNTIKLSIPLSCMRLEDDIIFQKIEYDSKFRDINIDAFILRKPFMSPYLSPSRFEPHYVGQDIEFFEKNFKALNANENKSQEPQLR